MKRTDARSSNRGDLSSHENCTGCGVCTLTCPVWHQTRDIMLTVCGRSRGLQSGGAPEEMRESITACALCGACSTVCPAGVDTVGLTIELRMSLGDSAERSTPRRFSAVGGRAAGKLFFPGSAMRRDEKILRLTLGLLQTDGFVLFDDAAISGLAGDMEAGIRPDPEDLLNFVRSMAGVTEIAAADGFMQRLLRQWLPAVRVSGVGETLLRRKDIKSALKAGDLYVIEPRGYHADHARLVNFYDRVRLETGCGLNTSLQRAAIPTGAAGRQPGAGRTRLDTAAQARWILDKRSPDRVVVEAVEDMEVFRKIPGLNAIHVSELGHAR
ncbi:MAG: hypothetical protein C0404_00185 [Verrucomicrobia bacterium]|nr:hypothetical protein [Verrucomicrobiota bacterium]